MPNAMECMAIFAHLCEYCIGVAPNVHLFRHYFVSRVENKAHRSGNISWISWVARKSWDYIHGLQCEGDWCWIQDEKAPEFCEARIVCVECSKEWSAFGLTNDRLRPAINRITRLKATGLI